LRVVTSERAERSAKELMFAQSAHLYWQRRPLTLRGRLGASVRRLGSPAYLTLPHIAAVCEEFSRSVLIECSEPLVPHTHPLLDELWRAAETKAESWPGQESAWKNWHGLDISNEAEYKSLRPVVEARNAIVHGLGQLTRRQTQKDGGAKVKKQLQTVGIRTNGRKLLIDDSAMRRCVDSAVRFINWLDLETQSRGLRSPRTTV
jgi:hypothetical protein